MQMVNGIQTAELLIMLTKAANKKSQLNRQLDPVILTTSQIQPLLSAVVRWQRRVREAALPARQTPLVVGLVDKRISSARPGRLASPFASHV